MITKLEILTQGTIENFDYSVGDVYKMIKMTEIEPSEYDKYMEICIIFKFVKKIKVY